MISHAIKKHSFIANQHDQENNTEPKKKILFLPANQVGIGWLPLEREFREVDATLRGPKNRHRLEFIPKFVDRYCYFRQTLLDHEPQVVHFFGHGTEDGLAVLDEGGIFPEQISTDAVSQLFEVFCPYVRCVTLSCYSEGKQGS